MVRAIARSANLIRYVEEAKKDELEREWVSKGYEVVRDGTFHERRVDLLARRAGEVVLFEVKAIDSLAQAREQVAELARMVAAEPNTTLQLVVANPPRARSIKIAGLGNTLREALSSDVPPELSKLAWHAVVKAVISPEIESVDVRPGEIRVAGSAAVVVELQNGSGGVERSSATSEERFPLEFDVSLDPMELSLQTFHSIKVDTSSLYE